MKTLICSLLLFVSVVPAVFGQLIDDASKPELVIVGNPGCVPDEWFRTDPALASLKSQCKFQLLPANSKLYLERYASRISGQQPMVLLQTADGRVIYAADAKTLPPSRDSLLAAIQSAYELAKEASKHSSSIQSDCDDGYCPSPTPEIDLPRPFDEAIPSILDQQFVKTNWFSSTLTWIMVAVGFVVFCGFAMLFLIVLLGLIYLVTRFVGR